MKKIIFIIATLILFFKINIFSADLYPFQSPQKQTQFNHLIAQLRCLVCQNESLSASNAAIAIDLKNKIYIMVQKNQSDTEIKSYLVKRYSNFILFKPPFIFETYALWLIPFFMLLIGGCVIFRMVSNKK